jgi:hypothetical protein
MSQFHSLDELVQAGEHSSHADKSSLTPPGTSGGIGAESQRDMGQEGTTSAAGLSRRKAAKPASRPRGARRVAKKRARWTATPDFSPPVSERAAGDTGGELVPVGAGAMQDIAASGFRASETASLAAADGVLVDSGGGQECQNAVNHTQVTVSQRFPEELRQLLVRIGVNLHATGPGRKHVLDAFMRGRLVSLLAMGLTLRQAASALGLSHNAIWKELRTNRELSEEVNAARFQAQIEPLLVVLRESKRSWRAATWLINYLTKSVQNREQTQDERGRFDKEAVMTHVRERAEVEAQSQIEHIRARRKVLQELQRQ